MPFQHVAAIIFARCSGTVLLGIRTTRCYALKIESIYSDIGIRTTGGSDGEVLLNPSSEYAIYRFY